jgi:HlyD family secretion protein
MNKRWIRALATSASLASLLALWGCDHRDGQRVQGYVEGEFVYVACPSAGALETLAVQRGALVKPGDLLFVIEHVSQQAARDEAARRAAQAKAQLEDARKGQRPSEIESMQARLGQAQASLAYTSKEFARQQALADQNAGSPQEIEQARSNYEQDRKRVAQYEADLTTAKLGQREDFISGAEANVKAAEAALSRAEWDLAQTQQTCKQAGVVFDTLYQPGEWVPAGKPVVAILPPQNVKVRAFVPQDRVSRLKLGDSLSVHVDGVAQPMTGKVSFVSPKVEFTPPVIYGQESRGKLVFMIELTFDEQTAATLHPGQPVDVQLPQ